MHECEQNYSGAINIYRFLIVEVKMQWKVHPFYGCSPHLGMGKTVIKHWSRRDGGKLLLQDKQTEDRLLSCNPSPVAQKTLSSLLYTL
jgi:hypothetical protein